MVTFNKKIIKKTADRSLLVAACLTLACMIFLITYQSFSSQKDREVLLSEGEKKAFINKIRTFVKKENRKLKYSQALLLKLSSNSRVNDFHNANNSKKLNALAKQFGLKEFDSEVDLEKLEQRINVIPSSLVVSFAILESNWGMSLSSKQKNNLFESTCRHGLCVHYPPALVPSRNVQKYTSIEKSVESFMKTINTDDKFDALRNARAGFKRRSQLFNGIKLLDSLAHSELYSRSVLAELRKTIKENNLE